MPTYVYNCDQCPCEGIDVQLALEEYSETLDCRTRNLCEHLDCTGTLHRAWAAPTIGYIEGAGESPRRFSK